MSFICPAPLVVSTENIYFTETVLGNCVVPCPTIEYTDGQWDTLVYSILSVSSITTVFTFCSLWCHLLEHHKYFIQIMWIGGFFFNSFVQTIFLIANLDDSVTCYGKAHFIEKGGLCVFQSCGMIFSLIWVECWSVIFFFDLYRRVQQSSQMVVSTSYELKVRYTAFAFAVSASLTAVPLAEANVGFDPLANIPYCLYMFSNYSNYFWWTLFLPMLVLVVVALGFCFLYSYRVHQIFRVSVASETLTGNVGRRMVSDDDMEAELRHSGATDYSVHTRRSDDVHDTNTGMELSEGCAEFSDHFRTTGDVRPSSTTANPLQGKGVEQEDPGRFGRDEDSFVSHVSVDSRKVGVGGGRARPISTDTDMSVTNSVWRLFPRPMATILKTTWRYNSVPIVFVFTYCLSTALIAAIIWELFYVKYDASIDAGEQFAGCLVTASFASQAAGIPQNQASVDAFAQEQCGSLPTDRPNVYMVYIMLLWTSGYGTIATLIFGFAGYQRKIVVFFRGTDAPTRADGSVGSDRTISSAVNAQTI